jgi:Fe-S-cluster containining protein
MFVPMKASLTDLLCTQCGLCCDGSLLADVELASRAEATRLEILGLEIEEDDSHGLLPLPCGALKGTRCSIYEHRPECCRTFECGLLQEVRRGAVEVERASRLIAETRMKIARVRELMTGLGTPARDLPLRESCAELLAGTVDLGPETQRRRAELEAAMSAVEEMLRKTFLGGVR